MPTPQPPVEWPFWPDPGTDDANKARDLRTVLSDEYKDAGYWGRHYSTVRMTVGTFFVSATTAAVYLRWDHASVPLAILAVVSAVLGLAVYSLFTAWTFAEMNRQRAIANAYRKWLHPDPCQRISPYDWRVASSGLPLGLGVFSLVAVLIAWWSWSAWQGHSSAVDPQLPIKVQVGQSQPVTIQVPVKVSVP